MKINNTTFTEPKNRKGALNLAVTFLLSIQNLKSKEENLMKNITDTETKLTTLMDTLANYKLQLEKIKDFSDNNSELLENLKKKYELTQAEILETKSAILRSQILDLERKRTLQEKDPTLL